MYGVDIHVEQGDLCRQMSAMRIWLDEHRFEPSTFFCRVTDYGMLVCIEFKVPREAEAFAERFDGQANGRLGAHLEEESALSPLGAVS
jgi:hypothetical protein